MKLKYSTILKACFIFFVLSAYSMFYFIRIPGVTHYDYSFTAVFGGIVTLVLLFIKNENIKKISKGYIFYLISTIIAVFFLSLYTISTYARQSFSITFRIAAQYMMFIWAVPIFCIMSKDKSEYNLLNVINAISLVWCIMALIHAVIYKNTGSIVFANVESVNTGFRGDFSRIALGPFANFSILYSFYRFYSVKIGNKLFFLISFVIMGTANMIILQSRAATAAVIISLIIIILFDNSRNYRLFIKLSVVVVFVVITIFSNILQNYIVDEYNRYDISVTAREYASEYYFSVFLRNPIFGFGFVRQLDYESIYRGSRLIASIDDVGFVGQLAVLGVFSLVIIVFLYLYLFKLTIDVKKKTGKFNSFMLSILAYILSTSLTLIIFDQQRIALLPVIIALFEYYSKKSAMSVPLNTKILIKGV